MRVDKYLSRRHNVSRVFIQELISRGLVRYRGIPVRKDMAVERIEPSRLEIEWPETAPGTLKPEPLPLEIIYSDEELAVINKPAGMVTHPFGRTTTGTLVNALLYHLENLSSGGNLMRPGIVHRLDRETSGLMVVARNDASHRFLSAEFEQRRVGKTYVALVKGTIPWKRRTISVPLGRDRKNWGRIGIGYLRGRESVTTIEVSAAWSVASLVTVFPETGRTHQIRVVMDFLGFPVIGDKRYGIPGTLDGLIGRHALHAAGLSFRHPVTKRPLEFRLPPPPDMVKLAGKLADLTASPG